tara:strand:- start:1868 stop:2887 length:1020 start_codon:yes stop_codon:yes gene_type:complete
MSLKEKTFIIAEAGANHNRDFSLAKKLINAAALAGANAVKFQTYSSETLYVKNTPDFACYTNINKLIKDIELPRHWQKDLISYCDDQGIEFISTPFDEWAIDELYSLGVKRLKIAGFEASDPRIIKHASATGLPLIITAGIGVDISMAKEIVGWVLEKNSSPNITFLHGNNAYPTPYTDINLGQIQKIKSVNFKCDVSVGLSDHTEGILIPPVAVGLGVSTIEKHFTTDRSLPGPDHCFAIEPDELFNMVRNIRLVESSMGVKDSAISDSEKSFTNCMRSVVTSKPILSGDIISISDITTKRPSLEGSVPASQYFNMVGKVANKGIGGDEVIFWEDIDN